MIKFSYAGPLSEAADKTNKTSELIILEFSLYTQHVAEIVL